MARFEILQWLYGPEKFPGLSRNGPLVYVPPQEESSGGGAQAPYPNSGW